MIFNDIESPEFWTSICYPWTWIFNMISPEWLYNGIFFGCGIRAKFRWINHVIEHLWQLLKFRWSKSQLTYNGSSHQSMHLFSRYGLIERTCMSDQGSFSSSCGRWFLCFEKSGCFQPWDMDGYVLMWSKQ